LAREFSSDKSKQLTEVQDRTGVDYSNMVLVDDLLQQLENVAELNVGLTLAGWGYNTEKQVQEARNQDIKVIKSPEDLYSSLKS